MRKLPVALQMYTVRDFAEKDFEGTLAAVSEQGYDGIELAGTYGLGFEEIKKAADKHGLPIISAHVPLPELEANAEATVKNYISLGCGYVAIPWVTAGYFGDAGALANTVGVFTKIGETCNANGAVLLYHNHDFEFVTLQDGSFGLDYLYASIPANILQTQLDTCWIRVAGQDPVEYVKKYAGRCPIVHLKDFYREGETAGKFILAEHEKKAGEAACRAFEFRPVGHGVQDFPSILAASVESGAKWVVVEQDTAVGMTSLEAAKESREYLRGIGW